MKRYDLVMHMHPRELGRFLAKVKDSGESCSPFVDDGASCKRYLSCDGCYWPWLCRDVSVHWCTNCEHYDKGGMCGNEGCQNYRSVKDYDDACPAWEPAPWWTEPVLKHICRTCEHYDDHIQRCLVGDGEYGADDDRPCRAWEAKKEALNG